MQVAIHLGVHCTDEDSLLKTLLQNRGLLASEGISIPGPGRYRKTVLRESLKLRGIPADTDFRDLLVGSIIDDESAHRMVLSYEDFLCISTRIFENGLLYDQASVRPKSLRGLFPGYGVDFFLAIRNPATFIPAVFRQKSQMILDFAAFLDGVDLDQIRWSDVIMAIAESNPESKITVWCNEDTPLIWPEVVREISGHGAFSDIEGGDNILAQIMQNEGLDRLQTYLASHPPRNELQRRRVLLAFLDKYAIADAVEEELDVPGWTDELVQNLTENYEADLHLIQGLSGVTLISP